jgi:hypothetical protein
MSMDVYDTGSLKLYKRGPIFHVRGTYDGKIIRKSTGHSDWHLANRMLDDLKTSLKHDWRVDKDAKDISWYHVAKWVCARQKTQAKWRSIPFDLKPNDIYEMMRTAQFRCSLSGIDFTKRIRPDGQPDPWSASIDRIEPRQGYILGNTRIVCLAANLAMNRWGFDTLLRLANGVVRSANYTAAEPENLALCVRENGHIPNEIN